MVKLESKGKELGNVLCVIKGSPRIYNKRIRAGDGTEQCLIVVKSKKIPVIYEEDYKDLTEEKIRKMMKPV